MKKILAAVLAVILVVALTSCAYSESFIGIGMVENRANGHVKLSFMSFKGKKVITIMCAGGESVFYEASLESGSMTVSFDVKKETVDSFTLEPTEGFSGVTGPFQKATVYITLYAAEKCENGSFDFWTEAPEPV